MKQLSLLPSPSLAAKPKNFIQNTTQSTNKKHVLCLIWNLINPIWTFKDLMRKKGQRQICKRFWVLKINIKTPFSYNQFQTINQKKKINHGKKCV